MRPEAEDGFDFEDESSMEATARAAHQLQSWGLRGTSPVESTDDAEGGQTCTMSKDADQTEVLGENPSTSSQPCPDAGGTKAASSREPCPEALVPVPDEGAI